MPSGYVLTSYVGVVVPRCGTHRAGEVEVHVSGLGVHEAGVVDLREVVRAHIPLRQVALAQPRALEQLALLALLRVQPRHRLGQTQSVHKGTV